jgi:hypothetical protein
MQMRALWSELKNQSFFSVFDPGFEKWTKINVHF